ncbi:muscle M-line assembly protein unc-89-like isoform X9 [Anneissia japonica]|uniref:muscle M-line assembly protein unc-89-like isoform X9 n=1 Tax=Anneissia japonica TaxID=1529436 RepID=UPI0014256038|nr:muscle M-line assembly protein unc-89-like isoform X9 [Anneissia japonica]
MERSVAAPTYSNLIPENCPQTVTQVEVESKRNAQWLEQSPGKLHNKHDGQLKPLAIKDQIIMKYARIYHAEQNINELLEKRRGHTTVNHHLFNPSQYKPTKFYSSMNYDMSVPCKYLGGKPVPSKGEINIEVCVKPTCTSIDHTIHKQCRTVTRAYRSELVVQLGTTKGKLYQSNTHRPNRDVIKLQKNDVAEQKTLGITSLRVEHDTHIPIDIVIANDSDKSIAPNMEMGRDSNDCPSRVNEYQSEDNSVLWGANHLLTTAQPQELENITKVMSKSLTDGSKIGLRSDIMVINHDQAIHLLKNEKSSHLCLNMNSQTLKHTKDTFKPNECVNTLTKLDEYTTSRSNGVIGLNSETTNDSNDNYDLRKVKSNDGLAMGFLSESVLYKCTNDSKPKIARNVLYDTDVKRDRPNKACDTPTTFDNKYRNNEPDLTDYVRVTTKDYNSRTDDEPGARVPADDKRVVSYDFLGKIDNDPGRCHGDCSDTDDERSSIDNVRVATDYEQIAAEDEKETPNFKGEMASKGLNCLNCMPSLGYNENLSSSKIGINLHGDQRRVWNAVHSKMVFNTDKDECSNECQQIHDSGLLEHTSAVVCAQGLRNFLEDANLSETIVYIENENDVMESISEMSNSYLPAIGHSELQIKTNLLTSYEVLKSDNDVTYEHGEEIIIEKSNMAIQQPGSQIPIMSSPLFTDMLNSNQLTQSIADAQNMDHIVEEKQIDEEKVSPVDGARDGSLSRTTTKLECEETLCKQKGFTHNDPLAEEGSSIDSDMHGSVCSKKCTSDSGYSITVHSHESRRNYSTDTEFESIREDANTDNTEDSNGSSESEYETASSNFKYSDVSDFENDVDEDPKMPLPVVTINVEMATPPEFAFRPQSRVVERGSTAKFICVLKGCPKPEVTWFNHGIILRDSKKHRSYEGIENMFVLEVTDVDPSDAGEYVCTASNSEGRIYASAELSIEELTLPIEQQQEPYFMNRLEDLTAFPGTDIQFCCQVGGNSAPQILWFHNGIGLKRCERFSFSRSDDGRCTLRITSIKADDEGEVACVASNVLGRATCCAYLNVKEYSKFTHEEHTDGNSNSVEQNVESLHHTTPYVPNIVAIEGTSTKFKCSVIDRKDNNCVMAQNSVEVDSDDDLLHVVGYQNSTRNRLFNNTSDPDLDMERAIRLSEKVDTCMDIVNTVLNLASLDNEGEKELRMRLEELRSGLSSSGSSTTDDQESSVNSLTSRSNCNTSLSIDEHLLSVDSKDIEPINPQDVSLESEISDIESLNRSSSCLNMEYVSSPLKNQRMQGYKQDPSFPEMAAHLLNIHNPYEMIRKVEAENKDTSIEMMADVLSSQIVIEGLSNYSKCKKNISNIPTKKAIGCKAGTTNIKTASNTNYLKAIGSFADKVVAEILIDAALRIKDITQSRHSYHTKEKMKGLNLPYDHANNLPQQLLNELIKEASEKTSQKNKLDQEIFNDLLHEIMLQAVVSEILKTRTPTLIHWNQQICKENTLQNNEHEETGKNNDAILKKLNSDFQMPLHLVDVSAPIPTSRQCDRYSISIEKGSVSDLRKNEKEKEILSINIESLDNPEKMSTCITAPEPKLMVPNFTQGLEMEEPISANLRKVKARNILSGFLGNAMLLEQQKLKPTVKLSRSQSDRTQRPILQLHGNLKTELKEPKGLLKRSFSERRGQGIKFQQENEKEVKASESKTTSPVKSEQVILPQENNVGNSETLKRSSAAQELPLAVTIQEPNTMKTEDQQLNLVSTEEPKHNNLERKKSEESDDQKVPQKSSISRSMSARIPVRRKSHSFIRKDPRYLSWQANNLPFQKEDTSSNRCRSVPNRTQSLFLPRSQFQQDQIVKEKNNKQNVIHEIATEQTKDKYIEEFCITNDVSVLFMEENKDRDNKNMKELTIHNKDIINEHVTIQNGQKHNDYVKDDKREKPEVLKDEFSVTKRPIRANRSDRPISSLINMFETTIKSSPRSSKVQEFGLTFKLDEKAKKARSVNRSQSMLCRKKENIVNVKMDNRLSMDGSVHLSQLDTLNICKDIIYQESVEKPDKKLVVYNELEHSSSGLTVPPTKSVSNNNELNVDNDVILATPVQQDDDDVFSLPVTNNSSCEEEPLYTKSRSLSSIELQQPEYNSESSDFEGAPTFRQTISPVTVKDGDPARLDVGVIGNPDPDIKWFKDGKELTEDQHYQYVLDENDVWSLILAEATPSDSGEYTCQAQNCHGSVSCTGYLKVEDDVANITEAELLLELRESSISNNQDNETVARLLKEHQENKTRNGSVSTSGAEDEMFCQYTVLDNYHNDRLSVQQGDKVEILETQSNEIWLIKHVDSSMIGYIPVSLLEKLDEEDSVKAKRNSVKLAIKELFPDIATPTENMYEKKLKRKMSAKERLLAMRQISDQDDSRDTFDMCVAIASYTPDEDDSDHIPLVEGQYVEILDSDSAIEWLVQTKPTKFNHPKRGWVPASHLMKDGSNMVPGQTESLNRMISRVILDEGDADLVGSKKQEALIKRRYVLEELLQTERTFVKNMLFCIESYLPLMDEQNAPPAVKGKKDVLFLNFEKICEFHKNIFVKELEECGNDAYSVGRAFIKWQCNFEYHVQYCKNKPKSESCLTPVVKACFDDYLRSKGIIDKFSLSDYLIKPIQRITKYQLLLKEVVKYTSRAKEDCIELEMALNVMMQVPKRANDLMHISLIEGFQGNINDLGKLYRQEDFTVWTGKQKGRGKERHVFLFKDQIMLTKIKKDPRSEGFTYAYKNHMTIPGIGMTEESRDERCFELWYGKASSSLSMTLQAKTKYVKEAWVKEIRSLLEQKQMEMLEAKASVERIYGTLHQTRSCLRSASSISSLNSEQGTLSNSSLLSKSSESLTFNETPSQQLTSDLGATFSLSVPDRLHGDSFTSIDSDTPPQNDCKELEVGALYEMSDDFIAGGLCGLELSKGEIVKLVETENNNVCIVQSMPSPGCCNGEEGSVPPYLLRRRKSVEEPVSIVEKPENLSVNVGDYAKFICTFSGMPTPTADWYFKGHVLENTKRIHADNGLWVSSVTITNVKGEDSGKYRCVISNAISTKSCTANLHVAYVWESQCTDAIECPDDVLQEFDDDTVTWLPDNSPSIATDQLLTGPFEMG